MREMLVFETKIIYWQIMKRSNTMKQKLTALFLCLTMIALCAVAGRNLFKTVPGYNGDMQVEIDIQDKKIKDIRIVSDNESSPVKNALSR